MSSSNEQIKKELNEKNKAYKGSGKTKAPLIAIAVIVLIYAFFFTSKFFINQPVTDAEDVTALGAETEFAENRTFTLCKAIYSPEQEMMEIVIQFNNKNYDNVNDYYYTLTCTGAKSKKMTIKEIYAEELFNVIRIENVPKKYSEIEFLFAPKVVEMSDVTDEITGSIILNENNVKFAKVKTDKTKESYYKDRLSGVKKVAESNLKKEKKHMAQLKENEKALQSEADDLEKNKKYMTNDEIKEKEAAIKANEESLINNKNEQRKAADLIQEYEKELAEAEKRIAEIE